MTPYPTFLKFIPTFKVLVTFSTAIIVKNIQHDMSEQKIFSNLALSNVSRLFLNTYFLANSKFVMEHAAKLRVFLAFS